MSTIVKQDDRWLSREEYDPNNAPMLPPKQIDDNEVTETHTVYDPSEIYHIDPITEPLLVEFAQGLKDAGILDLPQKQLEIEERMQRLEEQSVKQKAVKKGIDHQQLVDAFATALRETIVPVLRQLVDALASKKNEAINLAINHPDKPANQE